MALETLNNQYDIRHFAEGGSIADLYQSVLGRAPDAAGLAYWQGSGLDLGSIESAFRGSQEFQSMGGGGGGGGSSGGGESSVTVESAGPQYDNAQPINQPSQNFQDLGYGTLKPPSSTNAIADWYQTNLGRAPDQAGLNFWSNAFGDTLDPNEIAQLQASPEYLNRQAVSGFYDTELGRSAAEDTAGLDYWTNAANTGTSLEDIRKGIAGSSEGQTFDLNNLYKTEFGRTPDVPGLEYWQSQLAAGKSVEDIQKAFNESKEGIGFDIGNLYENVLGRKPDEAGLQFWLDAAEKGVPREEILKSFEQAPEYEVAEDYVNYLGRTPDAAGLKNYMDQLAAGKSALDIEREIAFSDESIKFNAPSVRSILETTLGKSIADQLSQDQINTYTRGILDPNRIMPGTNTLATQNDNLRDVYRQIALDPILGPKLKAENPKFWDQVTPLERNPENVKRTERIAYGDYGFVNINGVDVPKLNARVFDNIFGADGFGTITDFSHSRGNLTRDLGWPSNSFSNKAARGAEAIGVTTIPQTDEFGNTTYTYQGLDEAARMLGLDTSKFQDKQVQATTKDEYDSEGQLVQRAGEPAFQTDASGNRTPVMQTISRDQQLYDAINQSAKDIYLYTGDSLTPGKAKEGGAESFNTVLYKRSGDKLIPITAPVAHGGQQNMAVYQPKDYGFGYYAQGPAFVAAAALSFAMADPSFSLAAAVGSAMLPAAASAAIGATATGVVGATVLGAAAGALSSTAAGADPGKGALTGAVTGLVASGMKPLLSASPVASATKSIADASQGVFSQAQVGNIIGATMASTLASAANGANGNQILNSFKTALISSGLSEKAAQLAVAGVKEAFGDDPKTLARTAAATRLVTRTASTAALSGKNPEQIQAAVIATLVQNAASIAGAGGTPKSATSGFTKAEIDAVNQGAQLANQSGQTQYYELASNITSDQPQPLVSKNEIETSLYDSKYWDTNSQSWKPVPTAGGGGGAGSASSIGSTADLGKTPTTSELKKEFENGTLPSAADVNAALANGSLSKNVAEAYLKAIADFQQPTLDFSRADDSLNLGISLAVGLISNGASPKNAIDNVSKAVGLDPRIILKAINENNGITNKTGPITTTAGASTAGTANTPGTVGTVGGSTATGPTNVTGGSSTTGTDGTGAGTTGTGMASSGQGTGAGTGDGTGTGGGGGFDIGIGVGNNTGTGGGSGGGSGTGTGGGGIGGGGFGLTLPRIISPFLLQQFGGIQDLAPGLTAGGNYSLSGTPSTNINMDQMNPNFPLQQFAATSPASPLELSARQQFDEPIQMATGGSTTQQAYNPYNISSGISGSLTPGLTKARLEYILTGLPQSKAEGGSIEGHNPQFFSEGGLGSMENTFVEGDGDGTSDQVPAMLANGEFVIPADVVSGLGNGSNDAGAEVLHEFLKAIREHKHSGKADKLPPESKGPLAYLTNAKRKVKVA